MLYNLVLFLVNWWRVPAYSYNTLYNFIYFFWALLFKRWLVFFTGQRQVLWKPMSYLLNNSLILWITVQSTYWTFRARTGCRIESTKFSPYENCLFCSVLMYSYPTHFLPTAIKQIIINIIGHYNLHFLQQVD